MISNTRVGQPIRMVLQPITILSGPPSASSTVSPTRASGKPFTCTLALPSITTPGPWGGTGVGMGIYGCPAYRRLGLASPIEGQARRRLESPATLAGIRSAHSRHRVQDLTAVHASSYQLHALPACSSSIPLGESLTITLT